MTTKSQNLYKPQMQMKKFTFSLLLLFFCATSIQAQITQEQANAIVLQYLQNEVTPPYVLYVSTHVPSEADLVFTTHNEEIIKVKYACWAYYLNEHPDVNEPCQHRYLFVKENNGNLLEVITSNDMSPDLTQWTLVPLSVIDGERSNSVTLYPNPTTGELQITNYELRIEGIEVFDVYGRKQKAESRKQNVVDISHLPAGIYFVKIATETGIQTKKIIKL
jgi:hypothetical protein